MFLLQTIKGVSVCLCPLNWIGRREGRDSLLAVIYCVHRRERQPLGRFDSRIHLIFLHSPVSDRVCPSQHPVDETEGSVGEADHDGVDDVTHPHRPRSDTEVKEHTRFLDF